MHLPFCDVKCAYCDFYSLANRHVDHTFWARYGERLVEDLRQQHALLIADTPKPVLASIFFGGGTPSKAPASLVQNLIAAILAMFDHKLPDLEISAEGNPESLTDALLAGWRGAGINRISVGMQSLNESVLKYLGRLYNPQVYDQVLDKLRNAGFQNFSTDFITGVPGQSVQSTLDDIKFSLARGVTHLSLYQLTLEPGTLLRQRVETGARERPSDAAQVEQMDAAIDYLERSGYARYEISNFALGKNHCLHNLIYWTGRPYLGLGVAAHAFTGRRRFFHPRSLEKYMSDDYQLEEDRGISDRDVLINWLRLKKYYRADKIRNLFPSEKRMSVDEILNSAAARGWLEQKKGLIALTDDGLKYSDSLLNELWCMDAL